MGEGEVRPRWLGPVLGLILALLASGPAWSETLAAWTEVTGGEASLRVITDSACPLASVDGAPVATVTRSAADPAFPHQVCQVALPNGTKSAGLDGVAVPVPRGVVNRIVVIGDTGCRLKGSFVKDCHNPTLWPFAALAARAAEERPDLVIHVGDYYYRETPCPADRAGCADSPHGDAWPSWAADFFDPARPLLAAAPWVFVRGNHEQCGRGAAGWFRFLDAAPMPLVCPAAARPFIVPIGRERLLVVDSADTEDDHALPAKVAAFRAQLDGLAPGLGHAQGWIVTHRPIWGFVPERTGNVEESDELPVNRTEQAAVEGMGLAGIDLVLSGHVHLFATASFGPIRPAQWIVGNGGDARDGELPGIQTHSVTIAGKPAEAFVVEQFGYLVLDRIATGWRGTLHAVDGRILARCGLAGRDLACGGP